MAMKASGEKGARHGRVTFRDLAEALGVSKATVSLSLRGSTMVAASTRARVRDKAREMGYIYNRVAAGLSAGRTGAVGIAVHDLANPYFVRVLDALERALSQEGRMSFLCNARESAERQDLFAEKLAQHGADGLILCPAVGTGAKSAALLKRLGLPTVIIVREMPGADFDFVGNDEALALNLAASHLIGHGHRRIAMLGGGAPVFPARRRRVGFRAAVKKAGLSLGECPMIDCDTSAEGGEDAAKRALARKKPPTAFACFTDQIALGAVSALRKNGMVPGRDVAVAGCDDIDEAGRAYAELTTARVEKESIGRAAMEILTARMENPNAPRKRVVMRPRLIVRKSCGCGG